MALQIPDLAKKTYREMVEDALASIPAYTDKWTNHNPSDPGIAIIELLCWVSENILYMIDRISDETSDDNRQILGHFFCNSPDTF